MRRRAILWLGGLALVALALLLTDWLPWRLGLPGPAPRATRSDPRSLRSCSPRAPQERAVRPVRRPGVYRSSADQVRR